MKSVWSRLPKRLFVLETISISKVSNLIMEKFDGVSFHGIQFERYLTFWKSELRSMRPAIGSTVWIGADHLMRVFGTSQHGGTEKAKTPTPATPCGTPSSSSPSRPRGTTAMGIARGCAIPSPTTWLLLGSPQAGQAVARRTAHLRNAIVRHQQGHPPRPARDEPQQRGDHDEVRPHQPGGCPGGDGVPVQEGDRRLAVQEGE
jgi:hypothetical protein